MKTCIDLNCDMGEGFGPWHIGDDVDEPIMALISSANVATGFHAGDPNLMRRTVEWARAHGVGIGAHPGFADLRGFGRRHINATAGELVNDIVYQVGALREFTRWSGVPLQHLKPHGALYMHAAREMTFADALIDALRLIDADLPLYCMANSMLAQRAEARGAPIVREFFADRDYDASGSIVFTRQVSRLDPQAIAAKVLRACTAGTTETVEGGEVEIDFDSVCIHSDTPGALALVERTCAVLAEAGIAVVSMAEALRARG